MLYPEKSFPAKKPVEDFLPPVNITGATIHYQCLDKQVPLDNPGTPLLEISIRNGIPHMQECGGKGKCTTCRVRVLEGGHNLSARSAVENRLMKKRGWDTTVRLACQTKVLGPVTIERMIKTFPEMNRLQVEELSANRGEERQLVILFCDMRNFTAFVDQHLAFDVVHILNRLFATLGEPILMNNGYIYQYVGDEVVSLFGLESSCAGDNCLAAARAALGMQAALKTLNEELSSEFGAHIEVGIGIHFGPVIVGQVGHPSRQQFGIIGDAANVASRIQAANKKLDTNILASKEMLHHLPAGLMRIGKTAKMSLKGKSEPAQLFELLDFQKPDDLFLVQKTMNNLFRDEAGFAEEFYRRLFEVIPELRPLFKKDIQNQASLMTHMLKGAVYALSRPDTLVLGFQELGRRHVQYGVKKMHFELVRNVMMETLQEKLGTAYTQEVTTAWNNLLKKIFRNMREGAE